MLNQRNLKIGGICLVLLGFILFVYPGWFGFGRAPVVQLTPTVVAEDSLTPVNQNTVTQTATVESLTPKPEIVDVAYDPSYPEMQIPESSSVTCNFANNDKVTFSVSLTTLTITSTLSNENFSIEPEDVQANDMNGDKWVKLNAAGGVSVGYDNGWKSDWLSGCPEHIKTPQP